MTAVVIWRVLAALVAALTSMTHQPQEDDPGWDCATMGNRQCGPVITCVDTVCLIPPTQASRP